MTPGDRARSQATSTFSARLDRMRTPVRLAYVGIILLATLSALRWDLDPAAVAARLGRMLRPNVAPSDIIDGARNLAIFAGWGLIWMVTAPRSRPWTEVRHSVVTGAGLSLLVELLQALSDTRTASVLDLATNTGGSLLGALGSVIIVLGLSRRTGARSFVGVPASIFAIAYGTAVVAEAFVPLFRQERGIFVTGGLFQRLAIAFESFRWDSLRDLPLDDFLLFLPAGVFTVAALYELGYSYRIAATAAAVGAVVSFAVAEVAHGVLGISIQAGAVVVHVTAVAGGAGLAAWLLPSFTRQLRGAARPQALTVAYTAVLVLWALRPYQVELGPGAILEKFRSDWWIPLRSLGARADFFSVVDVIAPFLLYAPLGALLAVWPLRLLGPLSGFKPALYLAIGTEILQTLIASRTLDVTDLLIQVAGVAVGWVLVRRAEYVPYGAQLSSTRRDGPGRSRGQGPRR